MKEVRQYASKNPKIILVGNKSDLAKSADPELRERMTRQVNELVARLGQEGIVESIEVSAKAGARVPDVFERLVDQMMKMAAQKRPGLLSKENCSSSSTIGVSLLHMPQKSSKTLCCSLL